MDLQKGENNSKKDALEEAEATDHEDGQTRNRTNLEESINRVARGRGHTGDAEEGTDERGSSLGDSTIRPSSKSERSRRTSCSSRSQVSNFSEISKKKRIADFLAAKKLSELKEKELELEQEELAKEAELAERQLVKQKALARQKLEVQKALIRKELEFEKANLEDELWSDEEKNISQISEVDSVVQDWLDNQNNLKRIPPTKQKKPEEVRNHSPFQRNHMLSSSSLSLEADEKPPKIKDNHYEKFIIRQSIGKELPIFNGSPEEWLGFINQYKRTTKICDFSNEENIYRLKRCLKGEALESVKCLLVSPDLIDDVISTLEVRFGNPELIIMTLLANCKALKAPREDDPFSVMKFAQGVRQAAVTIQLLDSKHLQNPMLLVELENKLPMTIRTNWKREKKGTSVAPLTYFSKWIMDYALAITAGLPIKVAKEDERSRHNRQGWSKGTVLAAVESDRKDKSYNCSYCNETNHKIFKCPKFENLHLEKKWEFVKKGQLCFKCLLSGHRTLECKYMGKCKVQNCTKPHHTWLHKNDNFGKFNAKTSEQIDKKKENEARPSDDPASDHSLMIFSKRSLLQVVPVILTGPKGEMETHAILDTGTTNTLLDQEVAERLGLPGKTEPCEMQWMNSMVKSEKDSRLVTVNIRGRERNSKSYELYHVRTIRNLELPNQTIDVKEISQRWRHIKPYWPSLQNAKPKILIGVDNGMLLTPLRVVEGQGDGPMAYETRLGWTIFGNMTRRGRPGHQLCLQTNVKEPKEKDNDEDARLHRLVKESFSTESFGVKLGVAPKSREDLRAIDILEKTMRKEDGVFQTGLVWKSDNFQFPESRLMALTRLFAQERKLDKDPSFAKMYYRKMEENFEKRFARVLPAYEVDDTTNHWYLPHFGVQHPQKPGKVRIVFDAAARSNGVSLNDALLTGPDLLNSLGGILMKFRRHKIGISADIKDFFPSIKIIPAERKFQRFLWRGKDRKSAPKTCEMSSMIFGAKNSPFSANEIKHRNALEVKEEYPTATAAILQDHYMDDYLGGAHGEIEAKKLINEITEIHRRGGFEICNWVCNSEIVMKEIPESLRKMTQKDLSSSVELPTERVLGIWWNPKSDEFTYNLKFGRVDPVILKGEKIPTKREVLRIVMSIFDPLGFLTHFVIQAKIIMQSVWRSEIGWDEKLPNDINDLWQDWMTELKKVAGLKIPRIYCSDFTTAQRELHIFCDAGEKAFSAVAYLRFKLRGEVQISLVFGKARVAPLKHMSIPRLELQGAVVAARIGKTIQRELELTQESTTYWTDSKTVLQWIRSDTYKFKQFVAFRVGEIQEESNPDQWRWVPSKENVADDATKMKKIEFTMKSRWFSGPDFLKEEPSEWPKENSTEDENLDELELKTEFIGLATSGKNQVFVLPDIQRFSKWTRLLRATAMVRKASEIWLAKSKKSVVTTWQLQPEDLERSEAELSSLAQKESFVEEWALLTQNKPVPKNSVLYKLSPFMDNEIIRLGGRIENSSAVKSTKRPVILDSKHHLTKLLIEFYHVKFAHTGQETIVNELRQRYWIVGLRRAVRGVSARCTFCKTKRARPLVPVMGQLPSARLESGHFPFYNTGLDYFGPIIVTRGRSQEKRYGALFTCLATRAIHLEIAHKLDTSSCINAIRRMIARRGQPRRIYSDNGTNFKGADRELRESLLKINQSDINQECVNKGIEWHFNPPESPHMGGAWERLVRSVKTALSGVLQGKTPNDETLLTFVCEVENMVNSRPLTFVSGDPNDPEALTPNHFLLHRSSLAMVPGEFHDRDLIPPRLWRVTQRLADHFWMRWTKEYLPTLVKREKWFQPQRNVKVDDIVILIDKDLPRNVWLKGRVVKTYPGQDGIVRVVNILTKNGVYKRPVAKLIVIDENCSEEVVTSH